MFTNRLSYFKYLLPIVALIILLVPTALPTQAQCLSCIEWQYCQDNPNSDYCSEPDYSTHVCEEESEELVCIDEDGDGEDDNSSSDSRDENPYAKLLTR